MWNNSREKLCDLIRGTETNICCQTAICQTRILAVPQTIIVGLTKGESQEKALKHSDKVVFLTNLEQMFKHMATDLNTKLTTMHQRLSCALKDARFVIDFCCCLDTGNKLLFRINWL